MKLILFSDEECCTTVGVAYVECVPRQHEIIWFDLAVKTSDNKPTRPYSAKFMVMSVIWALKNTLQTEDYMISCYEKKVAGDVYVWVQPLDSETAAYCDRVL